MNADTNALVRAAMMDDPIQSPRAAQLLLEAEAVVVTTVSLCEFAWVLSSVYRQGTDAIARAMRGLLASSKVVAERAAVEAGLDVLQAGGDFADGVIAHCGAAGGGETFASFDRRALKLVAQCGQQVLDLNQDT